MTTLDSIRNVISKIILENDVRKPDLFCSEEVFSELRKRPDCQMHPTLQNTVVMLPNVYWTKSEEITVPNIVAHTKRGELILQYLELVTQLIFHEHGSFTDVQDIVKELINQQR